MLIREVFLLDEGVFADLYDNFVFKYAMKTIMETS